MSAAQIERIDWSEIVMDLRRSGWSYESIGAAVWRTTGWAWNLANIPGTSPRFEEGERLLATWANVKGKTPTDAPRISGF